MPKTVWIAATVGFLVPVFWIGFWLLNPFRDNPFLQTLAMVSCPPFYLQFSVLAPFLNAVLYALLALAWLKLRNPNPTA
jgi:hypothetical protein